MLKDAMPVKIEIRAGTVADVEMIAGLAARTFYDAFAESNTPENMDFYLASAFSVRQLREELSDTRSKFLIAEVDGAPAGYAKLYNGRPPDCIAGEDTIEIARLYVERPWLGSGVGAALMQACLDDARSEGYKTIYLGVWEHNNRARAFYQKWGFEVVGSHVFQMGDDPQTDILMQRRLSL